MLDGFERREIHLCFEDGKTNHDRANVGNTETVLFRPTSYTLSYTHIYTQISCLQVQKAKTLQELK